MNIPCYHVNAVQCRGYCSSTARRYLRWDQHVTVSCPASKSGNYRPRLSSPLGAILRHNLIHSLSLRYLLIVPVLLAIATAVVLFQHSDTNIYMLYSQCHARSRVPWLSHVPLLGTPSCFLVSFFGEAAASLRSSAILSVIFSFLAGLLTVSTVEAARICNGPSILIAYPTGLWLIFDLIGGAFVWELIIIPAFFHRSRKIITSRRQDLPISDTLSTHPILGESMRHLARTSETLAIPVAVALGFVVPSALMLTHTSPITVLIWLLFPVWTTFFRQSVRKLTTLPLARWSESWQDSLHLESSTLALARVYLLPILCSVVSQILLLWSLYQPDDRKEMTRSTLKFITIDAFFVGLTVLYWILVEAGWKVAAVMVFTSTVLGPGAGICLGWVYREATLNLTGASESGVTVVVVGGDPRGREEGAEAGEDTPLLR
ncbi:hypothetical protein QBC40DRAFT_312773 [Triangularia verruculosa]|uniref:Uncharacterized protein n=1 Tax=Triangularia verruculosa TaxID=2587418 RepID=A0AAN6XB23_9PEZI|nr:hypothetical protein QBC40DRAFT_312773 [Triangularia verruculosa]